MNSVTMPEPRRKISATADTFVHYLFATPGNEHILLAFVNAVQEDAGRPPVKQTQVLNPFNPKTFITDKRSIIDIKAVAKNDRHFVIEFQVIPHEAFLSRALYYWAITYIAQMKQGDDYDKLLPVVGVVPQYTVVKIPPFCAFLCMNGFWLLDLCPPKY